MSVKHNIISSFDKAEIAEIRVFNFIQEFAKNTLGTIVMNCLLKKMKQYKIKQRSIKTLGTINITLQHPKALFMILFLILNAA